MPDARVDKGWQQKGLTGYSTEAILGTLTHYGASTDEAGFKSAAESRFPLAIAQAWHEGWKGTGQFARFPSAAAEELWKRLAGERLSPIAVAETLEHVMTALARMMDGSPDAPVGKAFAEFDALRPRVPLDAGKPRAEFVDEVGVYLGKAMEAFHQFAHALAKEGHVEDAEAFAGIEEFLFPDRAGVAQAEVRAAKGERAEATADLEALAKDAARPAKLRLNAVDAMIGFDALEPAIAVAEPLLDEAEKAKDYHLAFDVAQRLGHGLQKLGKKSKLRELEKRLETLSEAHDAEHQH
jgi:hypothetical protein